MSNSSHSIFKSVNDWPEYLRACGLTQPSSLLNCLPHLLHALNIKPKLDTLLETFPYQQNTVDIINFIQIMKLLEFNHQHVSITLTHLDPRMLPCLFIRKDQRAFILLKSTQKTLTYYDGQTDEIYEIEHTSLDPLLWDGELFIFSKCTSKPHNKEISWFKRIMSKFGLLKLQLYVIQFFLTVLSLGIPLYILVIYDTVIPSESYTTLFNISLGAILALLAIYFLTYIQDRILTYLGTKLEIEAGYGMLNQIFSMPLFMLESASLISQLSRIQALDSLKDIYTNRTVILFLSSIFSSLFLIVIYSLAGWLVWIPIVTLAIASLMGLTFWTILKQKMHTLSQFNTEQQSLWMDISTNLPTIKYTHSEETWLNKMKSTSAEAAFATYKLELTNQMISTSFDTLITFSAIITLGLGTLGILHQSLSIGGLVATMMVLWSVLNPIRSFFTLISRIDQWLNNLKQMNQLMQIETEPLSLAENSQPNLKGHIKFLNVSFRYSNRTDPILLALNLELQPGKLTVITGSGECGSSTLLKLILKLYPAQVGYVHIDGYDIRQLNLHLLRHQISYETHDSDFFDGSIEENLIMMKPTASVEELNHVLKVVNLFDFVHNLPQGIHSPLKTYDQMNVPDELFNQFRLARAFLRNTCIILLDELLDYVSPELQQKVLAYLQEAAQTKTVVITSRRLSVLSQSSRLIVMDRGKLIADGPTELLLQEKLLANFIMVLNEQEEQLPKATLTR